jgi:hypothetical protein
MAARMPVAAPVTSATLSRGVPVSLLGPFVCFFVRSVCLANARTTQSTRPNGCRSSRRSHFSHAARVIAELGLCSTHQTRWDHKTQGR